MLDTMAASRHYRLYDYVAVPPLLTSIFDDETVIEGDEVSLSCTASGLPDPTYVFTKVRVHVHLVMIFLSVLLQITRQP